MTELAGKTALVTGGGSGIGRALALAVARAGAAVVVADILHDPAKATAAEIEAVEGRAVGVQCDVSDRASVRAVRAEAAKAFGPVLLVFANAGATSFDPIEDVSDETMEWMFQDNLMGVSNCAQVFIPDMLAAGQGLLWPPRPWQV